MCSTQPQNTQPPPHASQCPYHTLQLNADNCNAGAGRTLSVKAHLIFNIICITKPVEAGSLARQRLLIVLMRLKVDVLALLPHTVLELLLDRLDLALEGIYGGIVDTRGRRGIAARLDLDLQSVLKGVGDLVCRKRDGWIL